MASLDLIIARHRALQSDNILFAHIIIVAIVLGVPQLPHFPLSSTPSSRDIWGAGEKSCFTSHICSSPVIAQLSYGASSVHRRRRGARGILSMLFPPHRRPETSGGRARRAARISRNAVTFIVCSTSGTNRLSSRQFLIALFNLHS